MGSSWNSSQLKVLKLSSILSRVLWLFYTEPSVLWARRVSTFELSFERFLPRDAAVLVRSWESKFCPYVCPSHACFVTKPNNVLLIYFDATRKGSHSVTPTMVFLSDAPSVWNLRSKWPTPFAKRRLRQFPLITSQPHVTLMSPKGG